MIEKTSKLLLSPMLLLVLCGCIKEIEYTGEEAESLLAVSSITNVGSPFVLTVEKARFFLEDDFDHEPYISDQISAVLTDESTGQTQLMSNASSDIYFGMTPIHGHQYSLEIKHPDFETVTSSIEVHNPVTLLAVDTLIDPGPELGNFDFLKATLTWEDPADEENYYLIEVRQGTGLIFINSSDASIVNNTGLSPSGGVGSIFLGVTDQFFNGQTKSFELTTDYYDSNSSREFILYSCDRETFEYITSASEDSKLSEDVEDLEDVLAISLISLLYEPVKVPSNIQNGLGIFGTISSSIIIK